MTIAKAPLWRRKRPALLAVALVAVAAVVAVLAARTDLGAVKGSGVAATQARQLAPFRSVELAGSNNVTIRVGGRQSVVIHADNNLLGRVTTKVHGGRLVIGNLPGSFSTRSGMSVEIRMPSLTALSLSGSGNLFARHVGTSNLAVSLGGSGVLDASGNVTRLAVTLDGSGDARLGRLAARDVHADLGGSGRILVNATRSLDASVEGSGVIMYEGHPAHLSTSVTGSGAVVQTAV